MPTNPGGAAAPPLWQNRDFTRLWAADTISVLGSAMSGVAFPVIAVLLLGAGPKEMGLLAAVETASAVIIAIPAGVIADHFRRRPTLVAADLGRAALLALIPAAWASGNLTLELLYLVAFGVGLLSIAASIATASYLPAVIARESLTDGNAKLAAANSIADILGNAIAGPIVQALSGPAALLLDALSFAGSAILIGGIRTKEPRPEAPRHPGGWWQDVLKGPALLLGQPLLRDLTLMVTLYNVALTLQSAVLPLYYLRDLQFPPALIGLIFGSAAAGAVLGAAVTPGISQRLGEGGTFLLGGIVTLAGVLGFAAADEGPARWLVFLASFLAGCGSALYGVSQVSIRQAVVPAAVLGRVSATRQLILFGASAAAALVAGSAAEAVGVRWTLIAAAAVIVAPVGWAALSPVRRFRIAEHVVDGG